MSIARLRADRDGEAPKATKEGVAGVDWLWVDMDPRAGEDPDAERDRIPGVIERAEPAPSVVIDSGGGFWMLFHLDAPFEMPAPSDPEWAAAKNAVENRNRALFSKYDGDKGCFNLDRVGRLAV